MRHFPFAFTVGAEIKESHIKKDSSPHPLSLKSLEFTF
jgi:hypothetical protein